MAEQAGPEILYVDDDDAIRSAFTWLLRRAGFRTREANTGREALRLAAERPDLIILDVGLPDINGFEVCRRIKAHPATAAIPVLHMSGVYVTTEDKAQALDGGADGYLTKPVEPQELVATVRALLRLHAAEEAARQWQATFDAIHDGLALLGPDGRLLRCNRALAELLGQPPEVLLGRDCGELLRQAFGPAVEGLARPADVGREAAREVCLRERWFRVSADPVRDEDGGVSGHVYLLTDVTRGKLLEEQLRQGQKLEAVGRLAGGVAHDFNTLLTVILGNLTLLEQQLPAEGPHVELLETSQTAAWRAAELTRQLLGFSRRTKLSMRPLDLNHCVEETMALLARALGPSIEAEVRRAEGLWPVHADAGQMAQVLLNLALNARDAMPRGGRLLVEVANVALEGDAPGRGDFVRLRVSDSGAGVPPELLPRIFDPFFTTKEVGQGTGMGLAVVFGIVQQHGGWVECHSKPGAGARFDAYLPRYRGPAAEEDVENRG
jgi:PAS domain S-box-containing protein